MKAKKILSAIYRREQFTPGLLGVFVNPFYFARKSLMKNIRVIAPKLEGDLIDVGCGSKPYKAYFKNVNNYIGLEIGTGKNRNNKIADVLYDGKNVPFEDERFDSVLITEVLEHVFNVDEFLTEINRITKVGGKVLLTVPLIFGEHEPPYDFGRYTSFGLKYLLKKNGFKTIFHKKSCQNLSLFSVLLNHEVCIRKITNRGIVDQLIKTPIYILVNLIGLILSRIESKNLYLDNCILCEKISSR